MKVGIVTYFTPDNYGAVLQAYALQTVVKRLGYDCEIVDYVCKARRKKHKLQIPRNPVNLLRNLKVAFEKKHRIPAKQAGFADFRRRFLMLSPHCNIVSDIDVGRYQALIAGSDQIWNPNINEWDSAYWLAFANGKDVRKIAYAPSFGRATLTTAQKRDYAEYLKDFYVVSCRESDGVELVRTELHYPDASQTIDPTLLLEKSDYDICREERKDKPPRYVLCFYVGSIDNGNPLVDLARRMAKIHDASLVFVSNEVYSRSFFPPHFINPTPGEALDLISSAQFVVTNSFHGMVFSIQFEKEFFVYTGSGRENRVASLLDQCGIGERLIPQYSTGDALPNVGSINYQSVTAALQKPRGESLSFLRKALDGLEKTSRN